MSNIKQKVIIPVVEESLAVVVLLAGSSLGIDLDLEVALEDFIDFHPDTSNPLDSSYIQKKRGTTNQRGRRM